MKALKLAVVLVFLASNSYGQELTGVVRGVVTDQSELAVAGANIKVAGPTNIVVDTDSGGGYILTLPPGEYTITFSKTGFALKKLKITVRAGGNIILNVMLEVSGVTETITVEEKAPSIDTGAHTIGTTVSSDVYIKLPSGIGYIGLLTMAPGVRVEPVGGGVMSDGSSRSENKFHINGVDVSDAETGSLRITSNIPHEFIVETQIKRSSDAQYGGSLGAVVNGVLKGGENEIHGQFFSYYTNDIMNAGPGKSLRFSPFDDNEVEYFRNKKDHFYVVVPGYVVGGPIVKNKIFFLSGSRQSFSETERTTKFLRTQLSGTFFSKSRQDFTLNKIDFDFSLSGKPLQFSLAHIYSPLRVRGFLPNQEGTDSPDTLWHERGIRVPSAIILWKGTYFPNSKLTISAFGGWNYTNLKDTYGLSRGPSVSYLNSSIGREGVPRQFQAPRGDFTPNNFQTVKDIFSRQNAYLQAMYLANWRGPHVVSLGYQIDQIQNDALAHTWPDGRFLIAWGARWPGVTRRGGVQGRYGFYVEDQFETSGRVQSSAQAFFLQDNWQIRKNLTLNFGVRAEREYIPSFLEGDKYPKKAISFGFADKFTPRIGFAYDPTGSGKSKFSVGYAIVSDVIKYNLPRSAFGGDKWLRCFFPLNDPNVLSLKRGNPKRAFECLNLRVPANDLVDPNLKPMQQRMLTVGYERDFGGWIISIYVINKRLIRTVEDVGRLVVKGGIVEEQYTITNPGEGRSIDPSWFPPGTPRPATPKAKRNYRAVEIKFDKRSPSYFVSGSHTWGSLRGNYSGLSSSDERGRLSPNTDRDFDLPHMSRDSNGNFVYGRLATDRPHVFKLFSSKALLWRWGTSDAGFSFILQSGTPLSTQVPIITSANAFSFGRGDLGRTPMFSETSLNLGQEFKLPVFGENQRLRLEWTIGNLFNQQKTWLDAVTGYIHPNDGHIQVQRSLDVFRGYDPEKLRKEQGLRINPAYKMPSAFQSPRSMRIAVRFFF